MNELPPLAIVDIDGVVADVRHRLPGHGIDHVGRADERPSDHAALIADFHRSLDERPAAAG
jgi:hypothetical protein